MTAGRLRFRGAGHRRLYRKIDFRRDKAGIPAKVAALEYDPNRSARIALLIYEDGEKRYILAPVGLRSATCCNPVQMRKSARGMRCRLPICPWVRRFTISN